MNTTDLRFAADLLEWLEEQTSTTWSMTDYLRFNTAEGPIDAVVQMRPPNVNNCPIGESVTDGSEWFADIGVKNVGGNATADTPREAFKSAVRILQKRWQVMQEKNGEAMERLEGIE